MEQGLAERVLTIPRAGKRMLVLGIDALLCIATVAIAYFLRLDLWKLPEGTQWLSYIGALLLAIPLFVSFGLYRAIFRYAGWGALTAVIRACAVYALLYSSVFTFLGVRDIPRTTGLIQPVLLFVAIGMSRAIARYWLGGGYAQMRRLGDRPKLLIYGAGSAGRQLAAALETTGEMEVAGFIDDDPTLHRSVLNGKAIYPPHDLPDLFEKLNITDVLLAMPSASRARRGDIVDQMRGTAITIRTLPALMDLANGNITINDLRELDIEDLLGRDAIPPNQILLAKTIVGKTVLVTGAGGSIGSELCRQILALRPATLLLVEVSEPALYEIHRELHEGADIRIVPLLASVQDAARLGEIMRAWKPDTIYHAAAYKHVPLVEHNPGEGIRNNVFGTQILARAAVSAGVAHFVLISTDKAVRPTNVMGTTKRLAEMILQAMAAENTRTCFAMVRFGNVLGSSGSVVPLFREQIRSGGPVTITDDEMTRYFMTIPEAAQLVIQAGAMAKGGEVFVLDMGEPVKIRDLAVKMIELSGLAVRDDANPGGDIEVSVVGLRPGEKLYEELLIGDNPFPTIHPRILTANEAMISMAALTEGLDRISAALTANDAPAVRQGLRNLVPEFAPQSDLVDWVHLEAAAR